MSVANAPAKIAPRCGMYDVVSVMRAIVKASGTPSAHAAAVGHDRLAAIPGRGRHTVRVLLVDAFGCRWAFDVRGLGAELADTVEHLWDRARADGSHRDPAAEPPVFSARRHLDGTVEVQGGVQRVADDDVPYVLSRSLTLASIARRSGDCLMLHAAGLAAPDGAVVALVAPSGTGKTTAAVTLGRHLGYVSDETVAIEHDLAVRAYPKPLSVVVDPDRPSAKHERSPDDLELLRAPDTLRLAATVVLERDPDLTEPVLEPLGLVEAATLALPQTSAVARLDRPLDRLARALTAGHGPWRLRYSEVAACADLVAALAAGEAPGGLPDPVVWEWFDGSDRDHPAPTPGVEPSTESVVQRARYDDALVSGDAVLVLHERVPTSLPGLAAVVWLRSAEPTSVPELVDAATEAYGEHPDAEGLVLDTVRVLVDAGVVVVR
jgi:hypothetical protein